MIKSLNSRFKNILKSNQVNRKIHLSAISNYKTSMRDDLTLKRTFITTKILEPNKITDIFIPHHSLEAKYTIYNDITDKELQLNSSDIKSIVSDCWNINKVIGANIYHHELWES